jgi:hypothetical protein
VGLPFRLAGRWLTSIRRCLNSLSCPGQPYIMMSSSHQSTAHPSCTSAS